MSTGAGIMAVNEEGQLTADDLLTRCIGGFTQNSNESLNSTVWAMAPKTLNSSKKIIDIAVNIVRF